MTTAETKQIPSNPIMQRPEKYFNKKERKFSKIIFKVSL